MHSYATEYGAIRTVDATCDADAMGRRPLYELSSAGTCSTVMLLADAPATILATAGRGTDAATAFLVTADRSTNAATTILATSESMRNE